MAAFIDLTGKRFTRLLVINEILPRQRPTKWAVICDCGIKKQIIGSSLIRGNTQSCGCLQKEKVTTHNGTKERLFGIWQQMKSRCYNPNNNSYPRYGGKNITICTEWLNSYTIFKKWSINNKYKNNLSIDRYPDPYGNYEPDNCRWATKTQQAVHQRYRKHSSKYRGVTFAANAYQASICVQNKRIYLGRFTTELEAAMIRDQYIIDNKLKDYTTNNLKELIYDHN